MGKKFIFFDIDGTLLDHDKHLPESTLDAVFRLKKPDITSPSQPAAALLCLKS